MGTTNTSLVRRTLTWSSSSLSSENCIMSVIFPTLYTCLIPSFSFTCMHKTYMSESISRIWRCVHHLTHLKSTSFPFPSPWPLRRPSVALYGSSVHMTMWLKMVLLWVCDCAFYFWCPLKWSLQSWELLRRPQLGSPASCWMMRAQHSSPGSCSGRSRLLRNPVELPIMQRWVVESILCYI